MDASTSSSVMSLMFEKMDWTNLFKDFVSAPEGLYDATKWDGEKYRAFWGLNAFNFVYNNGVTTRCGEDHWATIVCATAKDDRNGYLDKEYRTVVNKLITNPWRALQLDFCGKCKRCVFAGEHANADKCHGMQVMSSAC
jgi:hypothetical protein